MQCHFSTRYVEVWSVVLTAACICCVSLPVTSGVGCLLTQCDRTTVVRRLCFDDYTHQWGYLLTFTQCCTCYVYQGIHWELQSLCGLLACAVLCCAVLCLHVCCGLCVYTGVYGYLCVCIVHVHWAYCMTWFWCMCLIYASGIIHCSSTWKWCRCEYISHLHFHLLIGIGVMECESWCLVTRDKVHFSFILSPYQALATTCKPAGSG